MRRKYRSYSQGHALQNAELPSVGHALQGAGQHCWSIPCELDFRLLDLLNGASKGNILSRGTEISKAFL